MALAIFAAGYTTLKVYKYDPADMSKLTESESYGGVIVDIVHDSTYLYIGGVTTNKVYQLDPSDLSKIAESLSYGGNIYGLATDANYVFAGGLTTQKAYKYDPSDMSKLAESASFSSDVWCMVSDGTYLYVGCANGYVYKLQISDMSTVDTLGTAYGGYIAKIELLDGMLYIGGSTGAKVWEIDPSTMEKTAESAAMGGTVYGVTNDGTYVYASSFYYDTIWKIDPADMSKVDESSSYGADIYDIKAAGIYVYAAGTSIFKLFQFDANLDKNAESLSYGGAVLSIDFFDPSLVLTAEQISDYIALSWV